MALGIRAVMSATQVRTQLCIADLGLGGVLQGARGHYSSSRSCPNKQIVCTNQGSLVVGVWLSLLCELGHFCISEVELL